jgi:regulatory protein
LFHTELLAELGMDASRLVPGAELDEDELAILALAAEEREAEQRGLALLARAEQSAYMLRTKLEIREFSRKAVALAIARLTASGLLDDRRFAEAYAAYRLAHRGGAAQGPASLISALRERGIDRKIAAEAVAGLLGPEERMEALAKAADKVMKKASGDKDKARSLLRALGYSSAEISEYFEEQD